MAAPYLPFFSLFKRKKKEDRERPSHRSTHLGPHVQRFAQSAIHRAPSYVGISRMSSSGPQLSGLHQSALGGKLTFIPPSPAAATLYDVGRRLCFLLSCQRHGMGGTCGTWAPSANPPHTHTRIPSPSVISKFHSRVCFDRAQLLAICKPPISSTTNQTATEVRRSTDGWRNFSIKSRLSAPFPPGSSARNPPSKSVNFGRFARRRAQCARCTLEYRSRNLGRSRRV